MNIEEYIASGILEAYLLAELNERESAEVERMLQRHPELRSELKELEATFQAMDFALAMEPPVAVENRLLTSIEFAKPKAKVVALPDNKLKQMRVYQLIAAASVTIALIASVVAVQYRDKYVQTNKQLIGLLEENTRMADQFNQTKEQVADYETAFAKVSDPAFAKVSMDGLEISPTSAAVVFWNKDTREVYLAIGDLPAAEREKQYQLWAIVDGKPVDAGVFDATETSSLLLKMKEIENAQAFAVTLEPKGGSANPTLDQMYLFGQPG